MPTKRKPNSSVPVPEPEPLWNSTTYDPEHAKKVFEAIITLTMKQSKWYKKPLANAKLDVAE